jgi:RNA polymerase sigma-70 factor (ECF subfamily)
MSTAKRRCEIESFYRRYRGTMLVQALRLTRSEADAGDLVQDTFERAYGALDTFRPGTNERCWLSTIMTRLFIDDWRRRRRRPVETPLQDFDLAAPTPEPEPEWRSVTVEDLRAALEGLPPQARTLVERQALAGIPYEVLAAELGIQAATVGTRLFRTRTKLKATLLARSKSRAGTREASPVKLAA